MKTLISRACVGIALLASSFAVVAQAWPARPITWIVPFAAGGPTDAMARDIADKVSRNIGQQVIIENAGGAGGTIGAGKAAKATADGYTFLVGHLGYMAAAPSIYPKLSYDPLKDFEPVLRFPDTPMVLLVPKSSPYKTADELIAFAKRSPGRLNFGHAGAGSTSHLVAALFASRAGIDVTTVPYKGAAPAMNDLIAGQVDAMFDQTNTALPQVDGRRVRAIAITSGQSIPQFPGVPALAEKALPGFEAATWYGLYAPKGTPMDAITKLHQAYVRALADTAWTQRMTDQGIRLLPEKLYSAAEFARHTAAEVDRWRKVATEAKITIE
jgi:tripartite-type tricarboxylate transporter receptor subunit TctC